MINKLLRNIIWLFVFINLSCSNSDGQQQVTKEQMQEWLAGKWRLEHFDLNSPPTPADADYEFRQSAAFQAFLDSSYIHFQNDGTFRERSLHISKTGQWSYTPSDVLVSVTLDESPVIRDTEYPVVVSKITKDTLELIIFSYDGKIRNRYVRWE